MMFCSTIAHSSSSRARFRKALAFIAAAAVTAAGIAMIADVSSDFLTGEMLLTARRVTPKLLTSAADPDEFMLRSALPLLLGIMLLCLGAACVVGLTVAPGDEERGVLARAYDSTLGKPLVVGACVAAVGWFILLHVVRALYA